MNLQKLFTGEMKSKAYLISPNEDLSQLPELASDHGFSLFVFEGSSIFDMDDFLNQFDILMKPPEHGRNWNAFEEYFRAVNWIQTKGIIVVYRDLQNFMTSTRHDYDQSDFNVLVDILVDLEDFREKRREKFHLVPYYVLLQGNSEVELPLERL
jgi:hypothetical protein